MTEPLAPDTEIMQLVETLQSDDDGDLAAVDALLARYQGDPRLHFMRGSILAGRGQPIDAHAAMARAVEIAPEYALARYQLGFFELTSGEADQALSTWGPLLRLPTDNYLRLFVEGMTHLIRDEFDAALTKYEEGIARNDENEPMNNDIRLLMRETRDLAARSAGPDGGDDDGDAETSATSLMLGQFGNRTIN